MTCLACKHYRLGATCEAFPDRIPLEIIAGGVVHTTVYPGQTGETVFELGANEVNDGILDV